MHESISPPLLFDLVFALNSKISVFCHKFDQFSLYLDDVAAGAQPEHQLIYWTDGAFPPIRRV